MTSASPPFRPPTGRRARLFLLDRLRTWLRFRPLRPLLREGGAVVVPPGEGEPTNNYRQSHKCKPTRELRSRHWRALDHILSDPTGRFTPTGRTRTAGLTGGPALVFAAGHDS